MSEVPHTILFDIGNVLGPDVWEVVLTDVEQGLVTRFELDEEAAVRAGEKAWKRYAEADMGTEGDFWADVSTELGVPIPMDVVEEVRDALFFINPESRDVLEYVKARGVRIGVISNNTAFWFPRQDAEIHISSYADKELIFLSHEHGRSKSGGLFDVAIEKLQTLAIDPGGVLVIDDRAGNVARAKDAGFQALHYSHRDGGSLLEAIKALLP